MGFLKSLKGKMSHKEEQDQYQDQQSGLSSDQKYLYQEQAQSPEITYDGKQASSRSDVYAPPPGPPPSHQAPELNPPPYESWLSVPDNSQLPPPPNLSNEYSPANNATFYSAENGHKWCAKNPVYTPSVPQGLEIVDLSRTGELGIDPAPHGFKGTIQKVNKQSWEIKTERSQQDMILLSTLPAYFAAVSNPLLPTSTSTTASFSFSIKINTLLNDAVIAIGFACKPYPPFRLPGWHRGSLAIHSDDGRRYVNDPHGGIDFMSPFQRGDEIRISMDIYAQSSPVQEYHGKIRDVRRIGTLSKCVAKVRVARNGQMEGEWQIHEERDGERDEGIEGLQGEADLYCAVGVFGKTGFLLNFDEQS